ncbi:MAG: hypothetical protein LQ339_000123 [Xanthoria mediterranea]|nr:MAG: hypothetical protein LQ339_000123 [Xanthoria mediterranea]
MHFSTDLIAFVAATLVTSAIAVPLENTVLVGQREPYTPPAPFSCTDLKTGTSPNCWNELKVDEYLKKWHQKNFPARCKGYTDWSTCFNLYAKPGKGPQNCTAINSDQCQQLNPTQHFLTPQWYYGSYNSWSINHFFSTWSNAIKQAHALNPSVLTNATKPQGIDEFLAAKNPNTNTSIDLVLNNLITLGPSNPQTDALRAVLKSFRPNSYSVADTTDSGKPEALLPALLQMRLADTLRHVETNLTSFLTMAANGTFSKPVSIDGFCDWVPGFCTVSLDAEPAEPFDG